MRDSNFLAEHNARVLWHPMAHPAEMRSHPPKVVMKAEGVHITDLDGKTVLDSVGGLWNVNLGYSCEQIKKAISDQLALMPYYSGFRGTSTGPAIELAYELTQFFADEGMVRVIFGSGGSDAVETALKTARQYWKVRGFRDRTKFISMKKGYHGTHFGGASVNGVIKNRRNYEPLLPGCFHIPCPYTYRNPFNERDPAKLAELCANALEDEIAFQGADTVAAFIMEPVLGAGGVIVPHESFMGRVRRICDKHDILLVADEVVTGFGRTGAWSGSRLWGVKPDMMTIAKAITCGYIPLGATMINEKVASAVEGNKDALGNFGHGYTYSGHPVSCAAGLATLEQTRKLKVDENAAVRGKELALGLAGLKDKHAIVGDIRCQGLMAAVELVSDHDKKLAAGKETMARVFDTVYDAEVMIRISGSNIILSPPLIISAADVQKIVSAIALGLAAAG